MWESFTAWLNKYEAIAIWLEGIALVAIFIWDRRDARADHEQMLAQLRIAQQQATASQATAQSLINSERAWIKIYPFSFKLIACNRLNWAIINSGRTTARITQVRVRCKKYAPIVTYDPTPVFRADAIVFPEVPLPPEDTLSVWSYIEAGEDRDYEGLTQQSIGEIRERGHELVAYASVNYVDSFGKPHEARFCYYYALAFEDFRVSLQAPAEYHKCD